MRDEYDRPPLDLLTIEEIEQAAYKIDEKYWPLILEFRHARFYPPSVPVPPRRPSQLLKTFQSYAQELFNAEAAKYKPFRLDGRFPTWLARLSDRIAVHLQKVWVQLEESDPKSTLLAHGVSNLSMDGSVRDALWDRLNYFRSKDSGHQEPPPAPDQTANQTESAENSKPIHESMADQLKRLQAECNLTAQELADAVGVDLRSIFRHLSGQALPRRTHLATYSKLFSEKLGKTVILKTSPKRQRNAI